MRLDNLSAPVGANKKRKRVGRGESSGYGKTAGRGGKGQTARTGKGKPGRGFEGGQMPMYRRMPKRGFIPPFAKRWIEINIDMLSAYFKSGDNVDITKVVNAGLASKNADGLRVIGRGDLGHALTVTANHFSATAKQKIEAVGGQAIELPPKVKFMRSKHTKNSKA
ncbi:MAG: 50S ribosomal protein L15 [Deltaproteobacteria bacterium]|nr:50S ribosomal protein L15 [Deltaproteobacteria bacterium]